MFSYHVRRPAVHHGHKQANQLARLSLIINIGDAAFWTILPLQIASLTGSDTAVGFYVALIAAIGAVAAVASSTMFSRYRKSIIGVASLVAMMALLAGMSFASDFWLLAVFDIPRSVAYLLVTVALGLLIRDHATAADLAVQEGRFYLYSNFGWLIGPVLAGYVAKFAGNDAVFVLVAGIFAVALGYLWLLHIGPHRAVTTEGHMITGREMLAGLRDYVRRPRLRTVFVLALGLEIWWIVSSIYIPLAVVDLGYGPEVVGWVVTAGIVPLVVMEAWVGRLAQRRGTRPYLLAGFFILAVGAASFPLLGFNSGLLLTMFAAINVGAGFIEPLTDTYFFEVASAQEAERFFGIYNASAPVAGLIGPVVAGSALAVGLGFNGVWVVTAIMLALCALLALRIRPGM